MKSLLVLLLSPFLAVDEFEGCKRSEATQRKEKQKKRRLFLRKEEILDKEGVAATANYGQRWIYFFLSNISEHTFLIAGTLWLQV
jgi:hypothetical protein